MQKLLFVTSSAAVTVYFYYIVEFTTRCLLLLNQREVENYIYYLKGVVITINCIALKLSALSWEESALSIKRRSEVGRSSSPGHSIFTFQSSWK
jgi:hypothetical protein